MTLKSTENVIFIKNNENPFTKINNHINKHFVNELNLIAHGSPGLIFLGTGIHIDNLHLANNWNVSQINLWSCNVGRDTNFINMFKKITGSHIVSSLKKLGNGITLENSSNQEITKMVKEFPIELHTNGVGFKVVNNNGVLTLYFLYGNWHPESWGGVDVPEGALALYSLKEGGDPNLAQDYNQKKYGNGGSIGNSTYIFESSPESDGESHSVDIGGGRDNGGITLLNEHSNVSYDLGESGSDKYNLLKTGLDSYFWIQSDNSLGEVVGSRSIYNHEWVSISNIQPGTYRATYDPNPNNPYSSSSLDGVRYNNTVSYNTTGTSPQGGGWQPNTNNFTVTWTPQGQIGDLIFTISPTGQIVLGYLDIVSVDSLEDGNVQLSHQQFQDEYRGIIGNIALVSLPNRGTLSYQVNGTGSRITLSNSDLTDNVQQKEDTVNSVPSDLVGVKVLTAAEVDTLIYESSKDFAGTDGLTWHPQDLTPDSNIINFYFSKSWLLVFNVANVDNDAPVLSSDSIEIIYLKNATASGNLLTNDYDPDPGDSLKTIESELIGTYGTLKIGNDGSYSYTSISDLSVLNEGDKVYESFKYQVSDKSELISESSLEITIIIKKVTMSIKLTNIGESLGKLTFTASFEISDFTVDDISISGGYLVNFLGSGAEYTADLIVDDFGEYTIQVLAGTFSYLGVENDNSNIEIFKKKNIINVPIKKDKEKAKLITKILRMKEPDINSFLTQFRAYMANNNFSVSEKENFKVYLLKNSEYSRAILLKILDLLDRRSTSNSQVSMIHENVEYNDFKNINQLLEVSLGKDIMNKYLVNQDLDVFHNICRFSSYLHTDFYHTMEDYTLVLSGGNDTLVSDLNLIPESESLTLISSLLVNPSHKLIEVSSASTDTFYASMNAGMKAIVDSLNVLSQHEEAMSDFRNLINKDSNGVGSSLGSMKLTLIKKFIVPLLQDLDYLKDTYYGLPVLINKEIV